ncbi:MAG: phytoene/squalene synthase family protein [Woeseiaceae bacterium]
MKTAKEILKHNGKSFYLASLVLDRTQAERSARLYAFCRYIDDLADEADNKDAARRHLLGVIFDLQNRHSDDAVVADFLALSTECDMPIAPAIDLVRGVLQDLDHEVLIKDVADLHHYCYRVAGTVGLLMCGVLGVRDSRAFPFAVDLGIGMQLTNIARDVLEDARAGRRYIPQSIIGDIGPEQLINPDEAMQSRIADSLCWMLGEADRFYRSGEAGLVFLPRRARLAIRIAARVYHRIGVRLRKSGFSAWRGRTVVSLPEKIIVGMSATGSHLRSRKNPQPPPLHAALLHRWLRQTTSIYS